MTEPDLEVWLYGVHVADLSEPRRFRYEMAFTEQALDTFGEGSQMLSLALPTSREPVRDIDAAPAVSRFLEGLLPEGNIRAQLSTDLGVLSNDMVALLRQVGQECAGAVQFVPPGQVPGSGSLRPLDRAELDLLVRDLPTYHLPAGTHLQASLAGVQDKILLTSLGDGRWAWPEDGAVSTHILKPEPTPGSTLEHLIQTEHWALGVAREAGLRAAPSRIETYAGRQAIVVERYDRDGSGTRIHQEDFCQALSLAPSAKYETVKVGDVGPYRLQRLARLATPRARDPERFLSGLLGAVTFNVVIGNGDAHSKNYSILIERSGAISLAPLYDVAPVMHLNSKFSGTGHAINASSNIGWISMDDLVQEARTWGMSASRAEVVVRSTMEATYEAAHAAILPEGAGPVLDRFDTLWTRRSWAVPAAASTRTDDALPTPDSTSASGWVRPYLRNGRPVSGYRRGPR